MGLKTKNSLRRKAWYLKKKQDDSRERRRVRILRKKQEKANPKLRAERLAKNKPITIDQKRVWDDVDDDSLGVSVDVEELRRRRLGKEVEAAKRKALEQDVAEHKDQEENEEMKDDEDDSLFDTDSEDSDETNDEGSKEREGRPHKISRDSRPPSEREESAAPSMAPSLTPSIALSTTSTNLDLTPASLALKFPMLFADEIRPEPKILVTTSLFGTIHNEAVQLASLFPNSDYIQRSAHKHGHKYSVREIAKFAHNRNYTSLLVLREDQKKPTGLTLVHLPSGPTFTFTVTNWIEGRKLPGHGNPTNHHPELLLNNFKTPLGLLTARIFLNLFPQKVEFQGRQVVTMHNQRDYIFVRRHRYIFREKRKTEKNVQSHDGKDVKAIEGIRAGLQELGPRFTLKLRRVDKGIGRAGSDGEDALPWEWKAKMEKQRTRFNM